MHLQIIHCRYQHGRNFGFQSDREIHGLPTITEPFESFSMPLLTQFCWRTFHKEITLICKTIYKQSFAYEKLEHHKNFPFNQKFRKFSGKVNKWYGHSLGIFSENPEILNFPCKSDRIIQPKILQLPEENSNGMEISDEKFPKVSVNLAKLSFYGKFGTAVQFITGNCQNFNHNFSSNVKLSTTSFRSRGKKGKIKKV